MTRRSTRTPHTLATVLLVGAVATACGNLTGDPATRATDGRLAMVSGRDDHGLLAQQTVPAYDGPRSDHVVAQIPDGTLVQVVGADHTWQHVVTVEGAHVDAWLDDFYLRGQLRLVGAPPTCASRIGGHEVQGGTLVTVWQAADSRVLVEQVTDTHVRGWAARSDVQELAPQGTDCGEDPPDSPPHHHGP